jgi:hypothetical protein
MIKSFFGRILQVFVALLAISFGKFAYDKWLWPLFQPKPTMGNLETSLNRGMHRETSITLGSQKIPCTMDMLGHKGTMVLHLADGSNRTVPFDIEMRSDKVIYHYHFEGENWDYAVSMEELIKLAQRPQR